MLPSCLGRIPDSSEGSVLGNEDLIKREAKLGKVVPIYSENLRINGLPSSTGSVIRPKVNSSIQNTT